MTKKNIPLPDAQAIAQEVIGWLSSESERIAVGGSIRRQAPRVGDVKIVCIPKHQPTLMDEAWGEDLIDVKVKVLIGDKVLAPLDKYGERYKKLLHLESGVQIDLFSVQFDTWPVQFAIRTGDATFSKALVTPRHFGGLLPRNHRVQDGRVWLQGQPLGFVEERDFIELCCGSWVPPEGRSVLAVSEIRRGWTVDRVNAQRRG